MVVAATSGIPDFSTRILFFTGKGGVGKTSLACATAVAMAQHGKRVLLVSTDPASNLDEVLGIRLSGEATPVPGAEGLFALNIDPEAAAKAYRDRLIEPYRGALPDAAINSMEEQLSGACTVEIAAFDEFTKLLGDPHATSGFDHIIFDTAPTGHTLRLLKLPAAWIGFINSNTSGTSCLGPLSGLETQKGLYDASLKALTDPATTTLILVSSPSRSALAEVHRSGCELAQMGVRNQRLFLNGLFTAKNRIDSKACALEARGQEALAGMPTGLAVLPRTDVPLLPYAPMGVENLARVFAGADTESIVYDLRPGESDPSDLSLADLINEMEKTGRGVVMAMGKGGVGKTTIASAIAIELAHRGHLVHLSTTDPAAHVAATVDGRVPNLSVSRIDPTVETREYSKAVIAKAARQLDAAGLAFLEEDLRSPCTEEVAVFSAFARTVAEGEHGFVILDTAPTGHTILLLDAAEAYHREVSRTMSDQPESVRNLLPLLRNPEFTRVLLVTLPEATPVHEAARLQDDLARAGISPFAWIVNQVFTRDRFTDPALIQRGLRERPLITEVRDRFASRMAVVPWEPIEPVGPERLRQLVTESAAVQVREMAGN
jgi:arsenite-transporting ATPase